jgi:hypothetical protein
MKTGNPDPDLPSGRGIIIFSGKICFFPLKILISGDDILENRGIISVEVITPKIFRGLIR